jgi:hypothetical protein
LVALQQRISPMSIKPNKANALGRQKALLLRHSAFCHR